MDPLLWITDPHFDHTRVALDLSDHQFSNVLITGDIAEAATIRPHLQRFTEQLPDGVSIYFTEGNHDYYGRSIAGLHKSLAKPINDRCHWLRASAGWVQLDDNTALLGQYAWYDAMYGDPQGTDVVLNDFNFVADLRHNFNSYQFTYMGRQGSRNKILAQLRTLARTAAKQARTTLVDCLAVNRRCVFATHVPPFDGASWHQGKISGKDLIPWFTCKAMGDMLLKVAAQCPDNQILVLCGHCHSSGTYQAASNLRVLTGLADYGRQVVSGVINDSSFEGWT